MRSFIGFTLLSLLLSAGVFAQPFYGARSFGINQHDSVPTFAAVAASGSGSLRHAQLYNGNIDRLYDVLARRDSAGNILWSQTFIYDTLYRYHHPKLIRIPGGDFCELMHGRNDSFPQTDYLMLRMDALGQLKFSKSFYATGAYDVLNSPDLKNTPQNEFIVCGDVIDRNTLTFHYLLFRTDSSGNLLWSKLYNPTSYKSYHAGMEYCRNGDIVITGYRYDSSAYSRVAITRTDGQGLMRWSNRYVNSPSLYAEDVAEMNQGKLVSLCNESDTVNGFVNTVLFQTDSAGNILWTKRILLPQHSLHSEKMIISSDNSILVFGQEFDGSNDMNGFLIKIDSLGNLLWFRFFDDMPVYDVAENANGDLEIASMDYTTSQNFYVRSNSFGITGCPGIEYTLQFDTPVFSVESDSTVIPITLSVRNIPVTVNNIAVNDTLQCSSPLMVSDPNQNPLLDIFPNPAQDQITIQCDERMEMVLIHNCAGQIVRTVRAENDQTIIGLADLSDGIYFAEIRTKEKPVFHKFIITHHH